MPCSFCKNVMTKCNKCGHVFAAGATDRLLKKSEREKAELLDRVEQLEDALAATLNLPYDERKKVIDKAMAPTVEMVL